MHQDRCNGSSSLRGQRYSTGPVSNAARRSSVTARGVG